MKICFEQIFWEPFEKKFVFSEGNFVKDGLWRMALLENSKIFQRLGFWLKKNTNVEGKVKVEVME